MPPLEVAINRLAGSASVPRLEIPGLTTSLFVVQGTHLPEWHATTTWVGGWVVRVMVANLVVARVMAADPKGQSDMRSIS